MHLIGNKLLMKARTICLFSKLLILSFGETILKVANEKV